VHEQRLGDLRADAQHRVERRHRLLEDEPDAGAATRRISDSGSIGQIAALEQHLAAGARVPAAAAA
jgi:hypothetical protein